jgi:uncharacterized membrane protein YbhN (UPF0104 family)
MAIRKLLGKSLQLCITTFCVYYTVSNINGSQLVDTIHNTRLEYIAGALTLFMLSQVVSSFRVYNIFRRFNYKLSWQSNMKLYAAGLFYNFFLPGGVGGDAYKGVRLRSVLGWPSKQILKMLFLDRAIGFGVLAVMIILLDPSGVLIPMLGLRLIAVVAMIAVGYAITHYIFKSQMIYFHTFGYSVMAQFLQISAVILIIEGMGIESTVSLMVWIFLISSAAGIISFAGIGVREFLFLSSAQFLTLSGETSATVGLWISIIGAIVSFMGGYFILFPKKQELENEIHLKTT